MKALVILAACLVTTQVNSFCQDRPENEGTPVISWDSLKAMISYPEIARRAGVQGYSDVEIQIDSSGNAEQVKVIGWNLFLNSIQEAVKKVKWYPRYFNGKPYSTTAFFEIQFQLKQIIDMPKRKILMIESDGPHGRTVETQSSTSSNSSKK
jgi:Gram-negative bacterial TonB protein C-terminal